MKEFSLDHEKFNGRVLVGSREVQWKISRWITRSTMENFSLDHEKFNERVLVESREVEWKSSSSITRSTMEEFSLDHEKYNGRVLVGSREVQWKISRSDCFSVFGDNFEFGHSKCLQIALSATNQGMYSLKKYIFLLLPW